MVELFDADLKRKGFDGVALPAGSYELHKINGAPVAVIDTGVSPNPRLPVVPGGDYIMGEDGLSDCDAHGTVVSSIIAAAPLGILPMPRACGTGYPTAVGRSGDGACRRAAWT